MAGSGALDDRVDRLGDQPVRLPVHRCGGVSVGRLDPEKNPLLLAEVFARLREQDPRYRLVVCGDGTWTMTLSKLEIELLAPTPTMP